MKNYKHSLKKFKDVATSSSRLQMLLPAALQMLLPAAAPVHILDVATSSSKCCYQQMLIQEKNYIKKNIILFLIYTKNVKPLRIKPLDKQKCKSRW